MEYTTFGRTGLRVSRLCLGTMNFGAFTDEKDAFAIMDRALEAGINFFDTCNIYPGPGQRGVTEALMGRWFAQGGGRRESVVLATKVNGNMDDPTDGPNNFLGLSAYKIRRHLEGSLKRLQTDHIELYQMHHVDRRVGWDELWGVFEPMVSRGTVDYIGGCNFAAWNLMEAQAAAANRHFMGLVSEQHHYHLLSRLPELEVLPAAKHLGLGVMTWSPLAEGMLSGKILNAAPGTRAERTAKRLTPKTREQLEAYSAFCREIGAPEPVVAVAWLLANPVVSCPIIGPRTMEQFESLLPALELKLDEDMMKRLDEIFPGPGGGAPEAYAW